MTGWLPAIPLSRLPVGSTPEGLGYRDRKLCVPVSRRVCPVRGRRLRLCL